MTRVELSKERAARVEVRRPQRVPLWTVPCADPSCPMKVDVRAYARPVGVYCDLGCWRHHHDQVGRERAAQRAQEAERLARQLERLDPHQRPHGR